MRRFRQARQDPSAAAPSAISVFAHLVSRADAERDEKRYAAAATLYAEALRLSPNHAGLHIQCGHMFKETGAFASAELHYSEALRLAPDDHDLALQLGHFYKILGRYDEAKKAYEEAARLKPGWDEPARELQVLRDSRWRGSAETAIDPDAVDQTGRENAGEIEHGLGRLSPGEIAPLVPALAPRRYVDLLHAHEEQIQVRRLGRKEVGYWGARRTLRGVEAVRGFCISLTPLVEIQVIVNGVAIHRGPLKGGYILKFEQDKQRRKKYVFNIWLDFSAFAYGLHALELRFIDAFEGGRSYHEQVVIAEPLLEADYPKSNALVNAPQDDPRPLETQIRTRPSMVQPAERTIFPDGVHNVVVLRTDQLGDMVASIPALRRLRELTRDARIVGLLTAANAELAATLNLFDEIILIDFPDDKLEQRRLMPLEAQDALRRRLAPYAFDIALDFAQSSTSRDLLQLTGAKFLYGTGGEDWPWMSGEIIFNTRDRLNQMDTTPHSTKVLALVEALGTVLKTQAPVIRREDLSRETLRAYGVAPEERFAVLHTGARVAFSRWPYYAKVAELLLKHTTLKVVMMSEEPNARATLPATLLAHDRFVLLEQRLPFDHFDTFLSYAEVMSGNDSGPKHLAALRGVNVVTLFAARINWTEWGQENAGVIISRRVPCAGCAIFHDEDECGKDFACIVDIKPAEVFDAMMAYVGQPERVSA